MDYKREKFYFITVFQKLPPNNGHFDVGAYRCWGFYKDRETAAKALHENWTDMTEYLYNYAVLEEYYEGLCGCTGNRQFFKYDAKKKGFFEIKEPDSLKHIGSFSIG